ncbi:thioesterase II family protein [Planotetraspora sp. GP83]|uniref:thioesterase II family protein n=1 Tax=Planotetraspora sp. GP83 TaxID=3156264 RepID=UPI0035143B5B
MTSPWVARLGPVADPRVRVVCVPQAGGGTATFRPLSGELPRDIDLLALRLPGRETRRREAPLRRMDDLVDTLLLELDRYKDLPLALFGYCSGAYLMIELARAMVRTGRPAPARLFACGACGPATVDRGRGVHAMPDAEFKDYLGQFNVTPPAILGDPALFGMFEPAIRADFEVFETAPFAPGPPLDVPVTAIAGRDDAGVPFEEVLEWREHTSRAFTLRVLPGSHDFFTANLRALGAAMASDLKCDLKEG